MSNQPDAVVVTGAGRGIGRAVALAVADLGIPTLCISRSPNCRETASTIMARGGVSEACLVDLGEHQHAEDLVSRWITERPYSRIGVVLAAGVVGPAGPLRDTDLAAWSRAFNVNVVGNLAVVRALLGRMLESRFGRVVFFGGGGAAYAYPHLPAYACTKAAVVRAAENLHEDLKDRGDFGVVCLAPGAVETDMLQEVREAGAEVRSIGPIEDPLAFIKAFLGDQGSALSGRFVHARDPWAEVLSGSRDLHDDDWKLRRIEP